MNIQEFNNLKVGDMVKARCPVCHDCGNYYVGRIVDKIHHWVDVVKIDAIGCNGVEFDKTDIVRKIEKPELGKGYFCETYGIAEKFLEDCEAWGIKWNSGDRATSTKSGFWREHLEEGVVFCMTENLISREVCITAGSIKQFTRSSTFALIDDINYVVEYPNGKVIWDKEEEKKKRETEKNMLKIGTFNVRCPCECHKRCCKQSCPCPEVKEVKRPAKVGEYIKIVDEFHIPETRGKYTNGDIGKVTRLKDVRYCRDGEVEISINGHENIHVIPREYVVLENYVPEVKEVKRPAKVGEYIKLNGKEFSFNEVGDILKVSRTGDRFVCVKPEDHPRETTRLTLSDMWNYHTNSYVVLENYVPAVKEVDRCAKVGEYIKIVDEWHTADSKGKYTNGDIGLVTRGCNGCAIRISINGHDDVPVSDVPREYVVLENYRP